MSLNLDSLEFVSLPGLHLTSFIQGRKRKAHHSKYAHDVRFGSGFVSEICSLRTMFALSDLVFFPVTGFEGQVNAGRPKYMQA